MKIKVRKIKIIQYGSKFKVKKSPIWKGHIGEVISISKLGKRKFIEGEMDNGFIGEWSINQVKIL